MSASPTVSRKRASSIWLACLAASWLTLAGPPAARAQEYVYALNETGKLTVNGVVVDSLPSSFDEDEPPGKVDLDQRWWNLFVTGSEFYSIRADGRVSKSGAKLFTLAFENVNKHSWVDVVVPGDGAVWALRSDGRISRDASSAQNFTQGSFEFMDLSTDGTDVYSLRSDGAIYRNNLNTKLFAFKAGNHMGEGEGDDPATVWDSLEWNATDGMLYGLRRDGSVVRGDPANPDDLVGDGDEASVGGPPQGELVAKLPFGDVATTSSSYIALSIDSLGRWWTVRGSGRVYNSDDVFDELINLPGDPDDDNDQVLRDIVGTSTGFLALRRDGRLYDATGTALINLPKNRYRALWRSMTPPNLSGLKNIRPKLARYAVKAVTGDDLSIPVLVTDADKAASDLLVSVDDASMPPGSTWDDVLRVLDWPNAGPAGNYKLKVMVDDGVGKPVKKTFKINVKDPDENEAKNRPPQPSKVKGAVMQAGLPFVLPLIVRDLDGDPVSITVDMSSSPFTLGAEFDEKTAEFRWDDPPLAEVGKHVVVFTLSDGTVTKTFKVKLKLESSLLAF